MISATVHLLIALDLMPAFDDARQRAAFAQTLTQGAVSTWIGATVLGATNFVLPGNWKHAGLALPVMAPAFYIVLNIVI